MALTGFVLVAAFNLVKEHGGHALGALLDRILLRCPLIHGTANGDAR
ncbi:DUF2933 domain-containing protein [Elioraea rosea]